MAGSNPASDTIEKQSPSSEGLFLYRETRETWLIGAYVGASGLIESDAMREGCVP